MEAELRTEYCATGRGKKFEKSGDKIVPGKRTYNDDGKLIQLWFINMPV